MGEYFDNVHVHTKDHLQVARAWQSYWEGRGETSAAWVSPAYGEWVSLFDWRTDRQEADVLTDLTAHLSRALDGVAIAFQVQDSDLAEYWLFNHGDEIDHYTSNAEYFAAYAQRPEVTPETGVYSGFGPDEKQGYPTEEDLSDGGDAGLLKSLTGTPTADVALEAILRTPATFAEDILTALAASIGMNDMWASLGYTYISTDSETVTGFHQFTHLPPGEPPKTQRFVEH